ncbi:uncharacterized protein LOC118739718 [Rhagoletis pomonella]|uniref:uncharacterized protein LOC118739718 n=1 Tax=Rhagoletis pomonella TaxID=28610 RepID=UPI00177CD716|nr:uncharacterized protein LOC118739718 [Rhagoletis pomonella]
MYAKTLYCYILLVFGNGVLWTNHERRIPFVHATQIVFTNVQCHSENKTLCEFKQCELKLLKRGFSELNIYLNVKQKADNVTVRAELFRKTNGYTPFMYNFTVDFCDFKRNPQRNPVLHIFFRFLERNSNLNHTCPYDHDVILKNFVMPDGVLMLLPYPKGDYMVQLNFAARNKWLIFVKVFVTLTE